MLVHQDPCSLSSTVIEYTSQPTGHVAKFSPMEQFRHDVATFRPKDIKHCMLNALFPFLKCSHDVPMI